MPDGRGRFITFEGGEGAGKSTQIRLLGERFESRGMSVVLTREPGGTPKAEEIRGLLLDPAPPALDPVAETLLHFAARADHLAQLIVPALQSGSTVLCDRFSDSTRAYQGYGGGVDLEKIDALDRMVVGPWQPDLTLYLRLDCETAAARRGIRSTGRLGTDRYEEMASDFHARVEQGFAELARRFPSRIAIVEASGDVEQVAGHIWDIVSSRLDLD